MKRALILLAVAVLIAAGCDSPTTTGQAGPAQAGPGQAGFPAGSPTAIAVEDGTVAVNPGTSVIRFRGTKNNGAHEGGFRQFSGKLTVDEAARALKDAEVEVQTDSLWSDNEKLTAHLKSPDFFNVNKHPTASFKSKEVRTGDGAGKVTIVGDLTLLGQTKEVAIPADVSVTEQGVTLKGEFTFDRTEFGMNYQPDRVHKEVTVYVVVGQKTGPSAGATGGPGGPRRGGPGGGGGGFNPEAFFKQRDADGDGKLTGAEISDRMKERLPEIDKDGDGAVTLDEFREGFRGRGGRGKADGKDKAGAKGEAGGEE